MRKHFRVPAVLLAATMLAACGSDDDGGGGGGGGDGEGLSLDQVRLAIDGDEAAGLIDELHRAFSCSLPSQCSCCSASRAQDRAEPAQAWYVMCCM